MKTDDSCHSSDIYAKSVHERSVHHSRKHPYHPHGGNWKLTPLPPLDVLIHFTIIRNNFVSPSPSGQQKFPPWGECGSFLERPNTHLPTIFCGIIVNI